MFNIAYATDLHISRSVPRTFDRLSSFVTKISVLKPHIKAVMMGGDLFTIEVTKEFNPWADMLTKPLDNEGKQFRLKDAIGTAEEALPELIKAVGGLPTFIISGNADTLSFEYMRDRYPKLHNIKFIDSEIVDIGGFKIFGVGGIEANNDGAQKILEHNGDWFRGNIGAKEFSEKIENGAFETFFWTKADWRRTVMMTHQPPRGYLDRFADYDNAGSQVVLDLVKIFAPLAVLSGHIHDAPTVDGKYVFGKTHRVIEDTGTVVINTGGKERHDKEGGVKLAVIDLDGLAEGKDPALAITQY